MRGRGNMRVISQMEPQGCLVAEKTVTAQKLETFRSRRLLGGHTQNILETQVLPGQDAPDHFT